MQFFPQVIHQNKINCQHLSRNQNNSTNNATDVLSPQIGRLTDRTASLVEIPCNIMQIDSAAEVQPKSVQINSTRWLR